LSTLLLVRRLSERPLWDTTLLPRANFPAFISLSGPQWQALRNGHPTRCPRRLDCAKLVCMLLNRAPCPEHLTKREIEQMPYNKELDDYIENMIVTLKNVRDFLREGRALTRLPTTESTALNAYEFEVNAIIVYDHVRNIKELDDDIANMIVTLYPSHRQRPAQEK
jgi:hypothetical protein